MEYIGLNCGLRESENGVKIAFLEYEKYITIKNSNYDFLRDIFKDYNGKNVNLTIYKNIDWPNSYENIYQLKKEFDNLSNLKRLKNRFNGKINLDNKKIERIINGEKFKDIIDDVYIDNISLSKYFRENRYNDYGCYAFFKIVINEI